MLSFFITQSILCISQRYEGSSPALSSVNYVLFECNRLQYDISICHIGSSVLFLCDTIKGDFINKAERMIKCYVSYIGLIFL